MRGAVGRMARGGPPTMPSNEAIARPYAHPAPYDGWNARGNLANMKPTEAIQLDNIFPGVQTVGLRAGCIDWKTGAANNVQSLLPYTGSSISKLFAATSVGIYDVTASGVFGAAAVACTNGYWHSLNFANSGGDWLFAVNGVDLAKTYNGAAWAIPAITGVASSTWNYVTLHKHRIWAIQQNSMNLWYLATDAMQGAATVFPVGALFKKGGHVVAIGSWTVDSGTGSDDIFVIATSNGQIALYQGTDPASSVSWALVGVYDVPKPIGARCLMDYGGDLLYLSATGLIPMSQLRQSSILTQASLISFNIDGAFIDAASSYGANRGWEIVIHKAANFLLVNVPLTVDTLSYQFVMNTTTKAWCRFTGWNASCWADFNGQLYYASGAKVCLAWTGLNDSGQPIVGQCAQAYSGLGSRSQKNVSLVRPNIGLSGAAQLSYALDADFRTFSGETDISYQPLNAGALWDIAQWDAGAWAGLAASFDAKWTTVPGDLGYLHSFRLQIVSSSGTFIWTSTDFAYRGAGIL